MTARPSTDYRGPDVVNDAEPQLRDPRRFARGFADDVTAARELTWGLLLQNLRGRYRQSALGYVWLLVTPLSTAAVWVFLRRAGIITLAETQVPYVAYVVAGLFLWQGFLRMLNGPLQQLNASRHYLTKIRFPWEALLLASWGEGLFELVVYLVVLGGVFALAGVDFTWTMLLAAPGGARLVVQGGGRGGVGCPPRGG